MRRITVLLLLVVAMAVGLGTPAQAAPPDYSMVQLKTTLLSAGTTLETMPNGLTYGWNDLRGETRWGRQPAQVRFLGDVQYVNGSGPFNGYVTITRADGSRLALRINGHSLAVPLETGTRTHFTGDISIMGGSGRFAQATGIGSMTGVRKAALGSPVEMTFALSILK